MLHVQHEVHHSEIALIVRTFSSRGHFSIDVIKDHSRQSRHHTKVIFQIRIAIRYVDLIMDLTFQLCTQIHREVKISDSLSNI